MLRLLPRPVAWWHYRLICTPQSRAGCRELAVGRSRASLNSVNMSAPYVRPGHAVALGVACSHSGVRIQKVLRLSQKSVATTCPSGPPFGSSRQHRLPVLAAATGPARLGEGRTLTPRLSLPLASLRPYQSPGRGIGRAGPENGSERWASARFLPADDATNRDPDLLSLAGRNGDGSGHEARTLATSR